MQEHSMNNVYIHTSQLRMYCVKKNVVHDRVSEATERELKAHSVIQNSQKTNEKKKKNPRDVKLFNLFFFFLSPYFQVLH